MQARVERLMEKLRRLKAKRRVLSYSEQFHGYEIPRPMERRKLEAFERRHRIEIPEEYRAYLLYGAHGGAGPGFGLLTLHAALQSLHRQRMDGPFPHSTPEARRLMRLRASRRGPHAMTGGWILDGVIPLSSFGCGWCSHVVVTGEQRGFVWYGGDGWAPEFRVVNDRPTQMGFFDWFDDWLNRALRMRENRSQPGPEPRT